MKNQKKKNYAIRAGIVLGFISFVALSLFAGSVTQISTEVGFAKWILDFLAYTLLNKLFYKLIVALLVGGFVTFAVNMATYGKAIKHNKVRSVSFHQDAEVEQTSKIA